MGAGPRWRVGLPRYARRASTPRSPSIRCSVTLIIVDFTPKPIGIKNAEHCRKGGVKFIVQGGAKDAVNGALQYLDAIGGFLTLAQPPVEEHKEIPPSLHKGPLCGEVCPLPCLSFPAVLCWVVIFIAPL